MKVLVVGCGSMGRNHVRVYSESHRVEGVLAVDSSPQSLAAIKDFHNTKTFSKVEDARGWEKA